MENLQCLDAVAAYKFGVLTERPAYLKFKYEKELYVLADGETAFITLTTRQGDAVLHLDDNTELELEFGKIFILLRSSILLSDEEAKTKLCFVSFII